MGFVKGIDHVCVVATDLEKSIDFYTRLLGFTLVNRERLDIQHIEIAVVAIGEANLELVKFTDTRPDFHYGDGLIEMIGVTVDDVFPVIEKLRAEGVEFLMDEPVNMGPGNYFIFFRGPSGEKLELVQKSGER
jgi:catechol 2,3-dioxygenase-like lactoylglutathione lyase family enzyme